MSGDSQNETRDPQGDQKWAQGMKRESKGNQKGAKSEPKDDDFASTKKILRPGREKVVEMVTAGKWNGIFLSITLHEEYSPQIMQKSITQKGCQMGANMELKPMPNLFQNNGNTYIETY